MLERLRGCVGKKEKSFELRGILTKLLLYSYFNLLGYLVLLVSLPIYIKNKFIYESILIILLFGLLVFLPEVWYVKFIQKMQRIVEVHVRILLSGIIITIMGSIILLSLFLMSKSNPFNEKGILLVLPNFVLSQPAAIALCLILAFIYIEYACYKWLIKSSVVQKVFSVLEYKVNGETYTLKNLKSDFTVTITLMGFLPILIDSVFSEYGFAKDLKYLTFVYFFCGVVPYIHSIYNNLK